MRAADLGAKTTLVTRDEFGGMAANDGPIPVRTLAHAARLLRDARQLERYGIAVGALALDYPRLLGRVREVVAEARSRAAYREQIDAAGAIVHERTGAARFVDPHTIETDSSACALNTATTDTQTHTREPMKRCSQARHSTAQPSFA